MRSAKRFAATRTEEDRLAEFVIDYAFGSGRHAMTFVSLTDRSPASPASLEHRMTFFARDGALAYPRSDGGAAGPA